MPFTRESNQVVDLTGRRILVVDDDRLNRRILAGILLPEGFQVIEADSGEKALELYGEVWPDLVLLDVVLPGINGFEACRQLRSRYGDQAAPVIFITAKSESDDVVAGLSAGGVDYLPKPIRAKEALARIRTHLQIRLLMAEQRRLVEQLSKANADKNKFLGMAAHDLRNPLASIRGLAEFLRDGVVGPLTPDQRDLVSTIHTASQEMLQMVNELLDVATIEAGELRLALEPAALTDLVEKAVYLANIEAAKKRTKIVLAAASRPTDATVDPNKIRQVVDNLLSNAVKYSPPGSTITVELGATTEGHTIAVSDQGPGTRRATGASFSRISAGLPSNPLGARKARD
jgi:signal transduction histidine kinase